MSSIDAAAFPHVGESVERYLAICTATPVLQKVAELSGEALSDYNELLNEYREAENAEEKLELLRTMLEILLDEPVKNIPVEEVEREAKTTLEGVAAAERFEEQALSFGGRLKRLRRTKGLNQKQLAEASNMTQPQISYLEGGKHRPQEATVKSLAEALDVSPEELLPLG